MRTIPAASTRDMLATLAELRRFLESARRPADLDPGAFGAAQWNAQKLEVSLLHYVVGGIEERAS